MPKRRRGRTVKQNRASASAANEDEDLKSAPHSFVVHKGNVGKHVQELTKDFRRVMEPFTASNIRARPKNVMKDFVHVAGLLHVTHMVSFTKTDLGPYVKIARFPRGPTLTFKIGDYTLSRDVKSSLKRQVTYEKQFQDHALLILNGFGNKGSSPAESSEIKKGPGAREVELMTSMFQNLFPSINVTKVKINSIRRCVLLNYDAEKDTVELRHYTIKVVPVGLSKGVKKLVQGKVPNLGRYDDVAEFLSRDANLSESEVEDDNEASRVTLPQESSVRLVELGPRMTLELIKIEEELHEGEVLYHKLVEKTEEEKKAIRAAREKRKKEKERRRKEQEKNVKKKAEAKEEHKKKSIEGMKVYKANLPEGFKASADSPAESEDDDDAEWFRKEVGENPDRDMFSAQQQRKRRGSSSSASMPNMARFRAKKFKSDGGKDGGGKGQRRDGQGPKREGWSKDKRQKKPLRVFNTQGVGPNFDKAKPNKGPRVVAKRGRGGGSRGGTNRGGMSRGGAARGGFSRGGGNRRGGRGGRK